MKEEKTFQRDIHNISKVFFFKLPIDKERKAEEGVDDRDIRSLFYEILWEWRSIYDLPIFPSWADEIKYDELVRGVGGMIRIGGNALSDEEIKKLFKKGGGEGGLTPADQEAINSRDVCEFCLEWVKNNPDGQIAISLIREIHKRNTQHINYPGNIPGDFRMSQRNIGYPPRSTLLNNRWDIEECMKGFVSWLNDPGRPDGWSPEIRDLIKPIVAHYYLTEIHPFGDGNGRTARALEALMIYRDTGFNLFGFYAMANYCNREKDRYIKLLGKVYVEEDVTDFVLFNLKALAESLSYVHGKIIEKIHFMVYENYLREKERGRKIKKREVAIVRLLMKQGSMGFEELVKENLFNVSLATRYRYLKRLEKEGLIRIGPDPENPNTKRVVPNVDVVKSVSLRIPDE